MHFMGIVAVVVGSLLVGGFLTVLGMSLGAVAANADRTTAHAIENLNRREQDEKGQAEKEGQAA